MIGGSTELEAADVAVVDIGRYVAALAVARAAGWRRGGVESGGGGAFGTASARKLLRDPRAAPNTSIKSVTVRIADDIGAAP